MFKVSLSGKRFSRGWAELFSPPPVKSSYFSWLLDFSVEECTAPPSCNRQQIISCRVLLEDKLSKLDPVQSNRVIALECVAMLSPSSNGIFGVSDLVVHSWCSKKLQIMQKKKAKHGRLKQETFVDVSQQRKSTVFFFLSNFQLL